jgi:hypothetical protein
MIDDVTNVLVVAAFVGALAFVLRYLRTRWFASSMGVHVMTFMTVLMLILGLAAATTFWGEFWNRDLLRLIDYSLINAILWWRTLILFNAQNFVKRRKKDVDR